MSEIAQIKVDAERLLPASLASRISDMASPEYKVEGHSIEGLKAEFLAFLDTNLPHDPPHPLSLERFAARHAGLRLLDLQFEVFRFQDNLTRRTYF